MALLDFTNKHALLHYSENQCKLQLTLETAAIDRAHAFGRMAFACPRERVSFWFPEEPILLKSCDHFLPYP